MTDPETEQSVSCDLQVISRYRCRGDMGGGEDYVVPHEFRLLTSGGTEVARLRADLVCVSELSEASLFAVCEGDSTRLGEACTALFAPNSIEIHPDLNPEGDHVSRFLFIHRSLFLQCVSAEARQAMLYRIATSVLNYDDVIVAWDTFAGLTAPQMRELGYARIAGTEFVFCHLTRRTPYSDFQELNGILPGIRVPVSREEGADFETLWLKTVDDIPAA